MTLASVLACCCLFAPAAAMLDYSRVHLVDHDPHTGNLLFRGNMPANGTHVFAIDLLLQYLRERAHEAAIDFPVAGNFTLTDVSLNNNFDGKDFKAHRAVLAASSDMLNVMLLGQWADSNDEVIELYGVDRNSFEHLLNFMYKGSVAVDKLDDVLNLLLSSEHLGMATVLDPPLFQVWGRHGS